MKYNEKNYQTLIKEVVKRPYTQYIYLNTIIKLKRILGESREIK